MNKIDWDKPIETIDGHPARVVGFSELYENEPRVIIEYRTAGIDNWNMTSHPVSKQPLPFFQNKVTWKSFHLYYDTDTRKLCGRSDDLEPYRDEIYIGEFAYDIPE